LSPLSPRQELEDAEVVRQLAEQRAREAEAKEAKTAAALAVATAAPPNPMTLLQPTISAMSDREKEGWREAVVALKQLVENLELQLTEAKCKRWRE